MCASSSTTTIFVFMRYANHKTTPAALARLIIDAAAVGVHDLLRERQTQPRTFDAARQGIMSAKELLEDAPFAAFRHAHAAVAHAQSASRQFDLNVLLIPRILLGIREQVYQHLRKRVAVALHENRRTGERASKRKSTLLQVRPVCRANVFHHGS